jgi:hypothetical protein
MRFCFAISVILASLITGDAFVPSQNVGRCQKQGVAPVYSTVEAETAASSSVGTDSTEVAPPANGASAPSNGVSGADIVAKMEAQLAKLREKDSKSPKLSKEVSDVSS